MYLKNHLSTFVFFLPLLGSWDSRAPSSWNTMTRLPYLVNTTTVHAVARQEARALAVRTLILQWRHNERNGVLNHQPHHCLLNRLFRNRSKKTSKLPVTDLCVGNSPLTGEFPAQMASNMENVSIWWPHRDLVRREYSGLSARRNKCVWCYSSRWYNCWSGIGLI